MSQTPDLFTSWQTGPAGHRRALRFHHYAERVRRAYEIRATGTDEVVDVVFGTDQADVERALVRADAKIEG